MIEAATEGRRWARGVASIGSNGFVVATAGRQVVRGLTTLTVASLVLAFAGCSSPRQFHDLETYAIGGLNQQATYYDSILRRPGRIEIISEVGDGASWISWQGDIDGCAVELGLGLDTDRDEDRRIPLHDWKSVARHHVVSFALRQSWTVGSIDGGLPPKVPVATPVRPLQGAGSLAEYIGQPCISLISEERLGPRWIRGEAVEFHQMDDRGTVLMVFRSPVQELCEASGATYEMDETVYAIAEGYSGVPIGDLEVDLIEPERSYFFEATFQEDRENGELLYSEEEEFLSVRSALRARIKGIVVERKIRVRHKFRLPGG